MIPYDVADYEYPTKNGSRTDDRNLISKRNERSVMDER